MLLTSGTRLGPYEIVAPLGAGGMGEVYRARDTKLAREVALKVLLDAVVNDPERVARFTREAHVLASLNHPHIAHLYGFETGPPTSFLVMELVEGSTLADLIAASPTGMPLEQTLSIAHQIADALEAAHELGIVHRDLKPANVKVRDDGAVKVLDFGLAKAVDPAAMSGADAVNSPTLTARATQLGMILGTAAFMAPEQAKGKVVDKRADIWAFGVVLYEMLTGRRLFDAEDVSETLAAVLTRDVSIASLPVDIPARLRALVRDCLIRDPKQRLRDIGDARLVLDKIIAGAPDDVGAPATTAGVPAGRRTRERVAWIAAATLTVALVATATMTVRYLREAALVVDPIQFTISAPEKSPFDGTVPQFAVSPDGRQVAFVAARQGALVLWVRSLATGVATPLMGTEWAQHPFWSPDSRFIGFFAGGKLKKVPGGGGIPAILCSAPTDRGGAWTGDNIILVSPTVNSPLQRVSADGTLTPVTELGKDEMSHRWPAFLPDGRHFLFFVGTGDGLMGQIRVGSLDSKDAVPVTASHSSGLYAAGHVLFVRDGSLMALPFDPDRWQSTGDAFQVAERVFTDSGAYAAVSASATDVLTYAHGSARDIGQLTWFDPAGRSLGPVGEPGEYYNVSLSRDERRAAVSLLSGSPPNRDIWLIDLTPAGARPRFTSDPGVDILPIWSRDDSQIAFGSNRGGPINIYVKASNRSGQEEPVSKSVTANYLTDWSLDGRVLLYTDQTAATGWDVWALPLTGDKKPEPFKHTQFNEDNAVFSPDGQWVAYDSDESGRREVYVTAFPHDSGGDHMVSGSGGWQPMWQGNNRLFFLSLDATLMSASISTAKAISSGPPETHFPTGASPPAFGSANRRQYAVAKGGTRFLVIVPEHNPTPINVVVNWLVAQKR